MSGALDLDAIRARYGYWYDSDDDIERGADGETLSHCIVREDVPALLAEVERLRVERDQAREECGHAKAMRKFASEELDQFIAAKSRAEAEAARWKHAYEMADPLLTERDDLAATVDRVREALAGHPRCEKHAGDDPITCGWKRAVLDARAAIEGTDS